MSYPTISRVLIYPKWCLVDLVHPYVQTPRSWKRTAAAQAPALVHACSRPSCSCAAALASEGERTEVIPWSVHIVRNYQEIGVVIFPFFLFCCCVTQDYVSWLPSLLTNDNFPTKVAGPTESKWRWSDAACS